MSKFEFRLGPFGIRSTGGGLLMHMGEGWREVHPSARDVHVTIPLVGDVPAHVTIVKGRSKRTCDRDYLNGEIFAPSRLTALMALLGQDLALHWLASMEPVSLEELTEAGFIAAPFSQAAVEKCLRRFIGINPLRIRVPSFDDMAQIGFELFCECATPPIDLPSAHTPLPILTAELRDDGLGRLVWLTYWDCAPPIIGGRRGWYAVPRDLISDDLLHRILAVRAGSGFLAELRRIGTHFRRTVVD